MQKINVGHTAPESNPCPSLQEFINVTHGEHAHLAVLATVHRAPGTDTGTGWGGTRISDSLIRDMAGSNDPRAEYYFARGIIREDYKGKLHSDDNWIASTLLVLDDVGEACKGEKTEDGEAGSNAADRVRAILGPPSYVIRSSQSSYQYGYLFTDAITDAAWIDALRLAVNAKFYGGQEPGGEQRVQWMRFPIGFNSKVARIAQNNGQPFPVTFTEWEPTRRYKPADLQAALADVWGVAASRAKGNNPDGHAGPRTDAEAQEYLKTSATYRGLDVLGVLAGAYAKGNGFMRLNACPWHHEHTAGEDTSVFNPATGGFDCKHGHCANRTGRDVTAWVKEELLRRERNGEAIAETWKQITAITNDCRDAKDVFAENPPPAHETDAAALPRVEIDCAGNLPRRIDEAAAALIRQSRLYEYGGHLVTIKRSRQRVHITPVDEGGLTEHLARAAAFVQTKTDKAGNVTKTEKDPDRKVVFALLSKAADLSAFPSLTGITRTPFLDDQGNVVQTNGAAHFDAKSGLYIDTAGVRFPEVKDADCTHANAVKALDVLRKPISAYRFDSAASEAVAIAALMLPVVRPAVPLVPGIAIDAPMKGSGKTKLASLPSIMATGQDPSLISQTKTSAELDKQFSAVLLAGGSMVILDNIEGTEWASPLICSAVTGSTLSLRRLGSSDVYDVRNVFSLFTTGNNISLPGDTTRRFLVCRVDPGVERPDTQRYGFDPIEVTRQTRADMVHAALLIMRAYVLAGSPAQNGQALGSFEGFSTFVRDALMWTGLPDIATSTNNASASEFVEPDMVAVLKAWKAFDDDQPVDRLTYTAKQLAELANATAAADGRPLYPDLHTALTAVCPGGVKAETVGRWLNRHKGKWGAGISLTCAGPNRNKVKGWRLETRARCKAEGFAAIEE